METSSVAGFAPVESASAHAQYSSSAGAATTESIIDLVAGTAGIESPH